MQKVSNGNAIEMKQSKGTKTVKVDFTSENMIKIIFYVFVETTLRWLGLQVSDKRYNVFTYQCVIFSKNPVSVGKKAKVCSEVRLLQ